MNHTPREQDDINLQISDWLISANTLTSKSEHLEYEIMGVNPQFSEQTEPKVHAMKSHLMYD
jgi:hypothetical protein